MDAESGGSLLSLLTMASLVLLVLNWFLEDEIRRRQPNILSGIQDALQGVTIHDYSRIVSRSIDRLYDAIFGPSVISFRAIFIAVAIAMVNTLYVFGRWDPHPFLSLFFTHLWVPVLCIIVANTLAVIPSIVTTRFFLKRVASEASNLKIIRFLLADAICTYLFVTFVVLVVSLFIVPITSSVSGPNPFNWRVVGILAGFEPSNAIRWIRGSPVSFDHVGTDWYAIAALLPAFFWAWLTVGSLAAYGAALALKSAGIRLVDRVLASKHTAIGLLAAFLGGIVIFIHAYISFLKGH